MPLNSSLTKHIFALPQSVSDQIYKMLRQKILDQELKGDDRLVENSLAEEFSISRTPIREALRRLEQDGLIERVPQGGLRVTKITEEDIREIYGIRSVLSGYAAEMAADRINRETIDHLKRINHKARMVLEDETLSNEEQIKQLFELNTYFHDTLYETANSKRLTNFLISLQELVLRYRILCLQDIAIRAEACGEHEQIVHLLEAGEKKKLASLMRKHVLEGCDAAIRAFWAAENGNS